ncbi:dynein light chain Tctex-type 5 isoform X1 [Brachyhypopomus gauderio]|uniref:dynein light chain Tctex-type 5 isoform X1 n=1 Tax=Brachyhypopomus gauderio TaxID=698409 RepID=UPI0040429B28
MHCLRFAQGLTTRIKTRVLGKCQTSLERKPHNWLRREQACLRLAVMRCEPRNLPTKPRTLPVQYLTSMNTVTMTIFHDLQSRWRILINLTVRDILKDVLANYLQEEKYEPELSRQMTKTIAEVVKARVKDLMIPRYKIIVVISIGQLADHSMQMSSRCLWDAANDTCASHTFKNSSLFAVANVYGVYFE